MVRRKRYKSNQRACRGNRYAFFKGLQRNDILFIDSSHIIRPQGMWLFEYLQVLPFLKQRCPRSYTRHIHTQNTMDGWIIDDNRLWNEQYLLELFFVQ